MTSPFATIKSHDLVTVTGAFDAREAGQVAWQGAKDGFNSAWGAGPIGMALSPDVAVLNGLYRGGRNVGQQLGWWKS